jgi:hypothetical protein
VAAFYFDNDVTERLWYRLRAGGHLVTLTKDRHATRAHDEQQLVTARELNATLVTHNYKDFLLLHRAWIMWARRWQIAETHPPILVLPQHPEQNLQQYIEALLQAGALADNTLYRYRSETGWVAVP